MCFFRRSSLLSARFIIPACQPVHVLLQPPPYRSTSERTLFLFASYSMRDAYA